MGGWRENSGGAGLWICIHFMRFRIHRFYHLMRIFVGPGFWNLDPDSGWPKSEQNRKKTRVFRSQNKYKKLLKIRKQRNLSDFLKKKKFAVINGLFTFFRFSLLKFVSRSGSRLRSPSQEKSNGERKKECGPRLWICIRFFLDPSPVVFFNSDPDPDPGAGIWIRIR